MHTKGKNIDKSFETRFTGIVGTFFMRDWKPLCPKQRKKTKLKRLCWNSL